MALSIKSVIVILDQNLASLNTWLSSTTINSIQSVTLVNGELLILYT